MQSAIVQSNQSTMHLITVELQWLEQLWNLENMFEQMSVNHSARLGGILGTLFSIFFNMKICCVFSLESPHRGDCNENTQHTIINIKKKITLNYPRYDNVCSYGMFS